MSSTTMTQRELPLTESFAGWAKLNPEEQKKVKQEATLVIEARKLEGKSKAAQGQHLLSLKVILEPKRLFTAFVLHNFHMSKATAYRYMEIFEIAEKVLPAPILEAAIERGTPIRKNLIAENPPPKTTDPVVISQYLSKLEELPQRNPKAALETDPEQLMKECVNFVGTRYSRLEGTPRQKQKWVSNLIGMLLTKFGVETNIKFSPVDIPNNFTVQRGRPALPAKAA